MLAGAHHLGALAELAGGADEPALGVDVVVELTHVSSGLRRQGDQVDRAARAVVLGDLRQQRRVHFSDQLAPYPFPLPLRTSAVLERRRVSDLETTHLRPPPRHAAD